MIGRKVELLSKEILGIEYLKEINRRGLSVEAKAVKRMGDGYRDETINSKFASATAIRNFLRTGSTNGLEEYVPQKSLEVLKKAAENGDLPTDINRLETAIMTFWRMTDPALLSEIAELGNGLEYRIKDAALSTDNLKDMEWYASTKKYTKAKIRRAMLFAMLGVTKSDLDAEPQYSSVLAANAPGRELLSSIRKETGNMKIVTKAADAPNCRQRELSERADALYTLVIPKPQCSGYLSKKKIYIE